MIKRDCQHLPHHSHYFWPLSHVFHLRHRSFAAFALHQDTNFTTSVRFSLFYSWMSCMYDRRRRRRSALEQLKKLEWRKHWFRHRGNIDYWQENWCVLMWIVNVFPNKLCGTTFHVSCRWFFFFLHDWVCSFLTIKPLIPGPKLHPVNSEESVSPGNCGYINPELAPSSLFGGIQWTPERFIASGG